MSVERGITVTAKEVIQSGERIITYEFPENFPLDLRPDFVAAAKKAGDSSSPREIVFSPAGNVREVR